MSACLTLAGLVYAAGIAAGEKDFVGTADGGEQVRLRLLAVAVEDFQYLKPEDDLAYTEDDARLFVETMKEVTGGALKEENIKLLTGKAATRAAVDAAWNDWVGGAASGDVLITFISTHGVIIGPEGYLLTWDTDPQRVPATSLPVKNVESYAQRSIARHIIQFTDACHAAITGASGLKSGPTNPINEVMNSVTGARNSYYNFASSLVTQESLESADYGGGHGAFTWGLVQGLKGDADRNRDGLIRLDELSVTVPGLVFELTGGDQTPEVKGQYDAKLVLAITSRIVLPEPWTAADDVALKARADAERERQVGPVRDAQAAEVEGLVSARQRAVASEWAALKVSSGDPAKASASSIAAVEQKVAGWKKDVVSAAARRVTLSGSVGWKGRTQALSGAVDVPGQAVPVSHSGTVQAAEAWLAVARAQKSTDGGSVSGGSDWTSPTLGKMKWIKPGTFTMGSPAGESGRSDDETQHQVTLTKGFLLMEAEVTQAQWQAVMGSNPSRFTDCGATCPVEGVSWDDIQVYIQKVSARDGVKYRLPTEAEWEYAARGGQEYIYAGSNDPGAVGWYNSNSGSKTHPGCQKQRNGYGLCDMTGNVWEWVQDLYGVYPGSTSDYVSNSSGSARVIRGGSWNDAPSIARVAYRYWYSPGSRSSTLGFRLARLL